VRFNGYRSLRRLTREELLEAAAEAKRNGTGESDFDGRTPPPKLLAQAVKVQAVVRKAQPALDAVAKAKRQGFHHARARRFQLHRPRRLDRRLGCGRPRARALARSSSRSGDSGDSDDPEPGPGSGLLDTRLLHNGHGPRWGPVAECCSNDPGRWSGRRKERRVRSLITNGTGCLSPNCTRCGSPLAGRGRVNHTAGIATWTWLCPCGRQRRARYEDRGRP
jgi:hypothetical protein